MCIRDSKYRLLVGKHTVVLFFGANDNLLELALSGTGRNQVTDVYKRQIVGILIVFSYILLFILIQNYTLLGCKDTNKF